MKKKGGVLKIGAFSIDDTLCPQVALHQLAFGQTFKIDQDVRLKNGSWYGMYFGTT